MMELLLAYFAAEKRDGILAFGAGLVALLASAWLVATRHPWRGATIPLTLIALVELAVAVSYLSRSAHIVPVLVGQLNEAPAALATAEVPRMTTAVRNFRITVVLEAVVLIAGVALALTARRDFWFAVGMGCLVQAAPLLVADTLGTRRATVYLDALKQLRSLGAERSVYRSSSDASSAAHHGDRVALQGAGGNGGGAP